MAVLMAAPVREGRHSSRPGQKRPRGRACAPARPFGVCPARAAEKKASAPAQDASRPGCPPPPTADRFPQKAASAAGGKGRFGQPAVASEGEWPPRMSPAKDSLPCLSRSAAPRELSTREQPHALPKGQKGEAPRSTGRFPGCSRHALGYFFFSACA